MEDEQTPDIGQLLGMLDKVGASIGDGDIRPAIIKKGTLDLVPVTVDETSSVEATIKEDVQHANNVLKAMYQGWEHVKTIQELCAMSSNTLNALTHRRKLLLQPSSFAEKFAKPKDWGFEPLK